MSRTDAPAAADRTDVGCAAPAAPAGLAAALVALRREIGAVAGVDELAARAAELPRQALDLLGDGAAAAADVPELTQAISDLTDRVTTCAVRIVAREMGMDLGRACWLAFGSQARSEQTWLTDQDNGLVFEAASDAAAAAERPAWMAFGQRVNEALARCGYPLCEGRVMAGQPLCCLSPDEWSRRFEHWMAHGDGNDLFAARIYFDLRPVCGNIALARRLQDLVRSEAAAVPRFIRQLAEVVLRRPAPLGLFGRVLTQDRGGERVFDLKLSGSALFVDAGRLWALAHRLGEVGTEGRLRAAARALRVPAGEAAAWVAGFRTLQQLRLRAQGRRLATAQTAARAWVPWRELDADARQSLRGALRAARLVQQRMTLDYCR
ncbi:MAG: hypothetical protein JNL85_03115 [Rubrivivax sp.]|nr:hypothetical protein [Rubrivivax sp.]